MVHYVSGDLFTSPAQTLVNTVNTEGVMGKGIALTFKRLFPAMYDEYRAICEQNKLRPGTLHLFRVGPRLIVNFPTKTTWRKPSRVEYIEAGLRTFSSHFTQIGVRSVAFPPLGCGNGELDFATQVQPLMEHYLAALPIPVYVYPPRRSRGLVEHRDIATMQAWLANEHATPPMDALWEDLRELLQRRRTFFTFKDHKPFTATMQQRANHEESITVATRTKGYQFARAQVDDLWNEFRRHLVITTQTWAGDTRAASYLLPILGELEYLECVKIASSPQALDGMASYGLKLSPVRGQSAAQRALSI